MENQFKIILFVVVFVLVFGSVGWLYFKAQDKVHFLHLVIACATVFNSVASIYRVLLLHYFNHKN